MKIGFKWAAILLVAMYSGVAHAQQSAPESTAPPLAKAETDTVVLTLGKKIRELYFDKAKAAVFETMLRRRLKNGEFYGQPADSLTKKLTRLLQNETHDIHFFVGRAKPKLEAGAAPPPPEAYNGGIREARMLEHNIGYLKWVRCIADDEAFAKIVGALTLLEGCSALIVDITNNPGGDGRSGGFINQHLYIDPEYQKLLIKKCTGETAWRQSEVPYNYTNGPRLYDVPVYIMVSGKTGSAAEYFAFTAQETKRATILGATTAGAGNPVTMVSFGDYFAYIPICEIKTADGKSIEAKGVVPDVRLESKDWIQETVNYIVKDLQ